MLGRGGSLAEVFLCDGERSSCAVYRTLEHLWEVEVEIFREGGGEGHMEML